MSKILSSLFGTGRVDAEDVDRSSSQRSNISLRSVQPIVIQETSGSTPKDNNPTLTTGTALQNETKAGWLTTITGKILNKKSTSIGVESPEGSSSFTQEQVSRHDLLADWYSSFKIFVNTFWRSSSLQIVGSGYIRYS